jgi:hypothetical protein
MHLLPLVLILYRGFLRVSGTRLSPVPGTFAAIHPNINTLGDCGRFPAGSN